MPIILLLAVKKFIFKNWTLEQDLKQNQNVTVNHILWLMLLNWRMKDLLYDGAVCRLLYYPCLIWAGLENTERRKKFSHLLIMKQMSERIQQFFFKRESDKGRVSSWDKHLVVISYSYFNLVENVWMYPDLICCL